MNTITDNPIIAMMGSKKGYVKISTVKANIDIEFECHQADIRTITLNADGTLLATASTKGTLIRVFDSSTGDALKEVRRGSESADVQCIAFSNLSIYLACTSDKGTAHVFSLCSTEGDGFDFESSVFQKEPEDEDINLMRRESILTKTDKGNLKNKESLFKFMKKVLPKYFSSEWSFAQIKIAGAKDKFTECGFIGEDKIVLISWDMKGKSKYVYKTYSL